MESSELPKMDMHKAGERFGFLIRNKAHSENPKVYLYNDDRGFNTQTMRHLPLLRDTSPQCWWIPSADGGAVGVFIAPIRKVWYAKHYDKWAMTSDPTGFIGVFFCTLNEIGIPVLASSMAFTTENVTLDTPLRVVYLEPGQSNAVQRAHSHWALIAYKCMLAKKFNIVTEVHEQPASEPKPE